MKNPPRLRINVLHEKEELQSLIWVCRKLLQAQCKIISPQEELQLLKFPKTKTCYAICTRWNHINITLSEKRASLHCLAPFHSLDRPLTLCSNPDRETMVHWDVGGAQNSSPELTQICAEHTVWPLRPCCPAQSPWPQDCNRGARRQFPPGTSNYTTCVALPLSNSTARSSPRISFLLDRRNDE